MLQQRLSTFGFMLVLAFGLCIAAQPNSVCAAEKININTASAEMLQELDGVGPALAERIVEYRKGSPFESPQELTEVKGIGPKTLNDIEGRISVE
jgi:competence ComEA-like helix-hairpin-helix protein